MLPDESFHVEVSTLVIDYLIIKIDEVLFCNPMVQYLITDASGRLVRKGRFNGPSMQLHVNHLNEGNYAIQLCINDAAPSVYYFTKVMANIPGELLYAHSHRYH